MVSLSHIYDLAAASLTFATFVFEKVHASARSLMQGSLYFSVSSNRGYTTADDHIHPYHSVASPHTCKAQIVRTLGFMDAIRVSSICHVLQCCCGPASDLAACFPSQPLPPGVPFSCAKLTVVCLSGPSVLRKAACHLAWNCLCQKLGKEGVFLEQPSKTCPVSHTVSRRVKEALVSYVQMRREIL